MHCLLTELLFLVKFPNWWLSILNSTQLWSSPSIGRTSLGELQLDDYQLLLHLGQTSTGLQSIVIEFQPVKIIWGGVQKNEILPFQLNFMISTEFHYFNSISPFQLNFIISTEFLHFNWIPQFQLNGTISTQFLQFNWISPFQLNFTMSTEFHHFNWISPFQLNFTNSTEFHHFNWISPL